jgi:hypothetical protein
MASTNLLTRPSTVAWVVSAALPIIGHKANYAETNERGENSNETDMVGHSSFRIEAGAAKILIDQFRSDNKSWDKGWIGCCAGEDSTQGGGQ